jgi:adenylosuccinate lyase
MKAAGDMVLAEPAYILLSLAGQPEAHETVRKLTLECEQSGKPLVDALKQHPDIWSALSEQLAMVMPIDAESFFTDPSRYTGVAAVRAGELTAVFRKSMAVIQEALK